VGGAQTVGIGTKTTWAGGVVRRPFKGKGPIPLGNPGREGRGTWVWKGGGRRTHGYFPYNSGGVPSGGSRLGDRIKKKKQFGEVKDRGGWGQKEKHRLFHKSENTGSFFFKMGGGKGETQPLVVSGSGATITSVGEVKP